MSRWKTIQKNITTIPQWKLALLAVVAIALSWWVSNALLTYFPIRNHAMNEYTKHMKTICVGRYVIDVPYQFELVKTTQNINGINIERLPKSVADQHAFEIEVKEMEKRLRDDLAKLDYSGIEKVVRPDASNIVFVYFRQSRKKRISHLEAYSLKGNTIYKLNQDALPEQTTKEISTIHTLTKSISLRENASIPTMNGTCIDGGFVSGKDFEHEEVAIALGMSSNPEFSFSVAVEKTPPPATTERLNARIDRDWYTQALSQAAGKVTTHRKSHRQLLNQEGDERVFSGSEKGWHIWTAEAEFYGDGTVEKQTLKFNMLNNSKADTPATQSTGMLTDDIALSIWDRTIQSTRMRSGAI